VILMGLEKNEKLVAAVVSDQQTLTVLGTGRAGKEKEIDLNSKALAQHAGHRARMGKALPEKLKPSAFRLKPTPLPEDKS
jgi:topoisomerase-4 subunit A